jgi:peptidoglycan/xylan/chitin deacetylase (PgdA/CDA1 family)
MISKAFFARMLLCVLALSATAFGQLTDQQISGSSSDTHPGLIFLTHDDMMEEPTLFGGVYTTNQLIALLQSYGFSDAFFLVGCHIYGQPLSLPKSSMCGQNTGDVPISVLQGVVDAGFLVGNHSFSHLGMSQLQPQDMVTDIRRNQVLIDSLGQRLGLRLFRCPGLDCGKATSMNTQPDLARLRGPINADVGAGFIPDNIMPVPPGVQDVNGEGGDWWFYQNNLPPEFAGYYYVRDIANAGSQHGVIVLLHTRTEMMTGSDGSRGFFPVKLLQYIIDHVPAGFSFAPMDGIPGLLGNIRTTKPALLTHEFGTDDGQGRVVAGRITGGTAEEICKARESSIRCMSWQADVTRKSLSNPKVGTAASSLEFGPSTSWREIGDADWSRKYGSRFWLVDLNGDRRADLVVPSSAGLRVGYSNGLNGFSALTPLLEAGNLDYRAVRFADVNQDGLPDVIAWTQGVVYVYLNNGRGFNAPVAASLDFPASIFGGDLYASSMQMLDVNGDGCADLAMRGPTDVFVALSDCAGKFSPAQSWSRKFSDRQNFALASQNLTFAAAKIDGKVGLAAGLFTGGIVFQESDSAAKRFGQYRYIMSNRGFSGDPDYHPEVYASDVIFTDLYGDGDTVPVQVRANGLFVSRLRVREQ